jgi:hypothetical protein
LLNRRSIAGNTRLSTVVAEGDFYALTNSNPQFFYAHLLWICEIDSSDGSGIRFLFLPSCKRAF